MNFENINFFLLDLNFMECQYNLLSTQMRPFWLILLQKFRDHPLLWILIWFAFWMNLSQNVQSAILQKVPEHPLPREKGVFFRWWFHLFSRRVRLSWSILRQNVPDAPEERRRESPPPHCLQKKNSKNIKVKGVHIPSLIKLGPLS